MKTLWLLTKKNLKMLVRSRGSALIVIFAPLLLILLLGLSYDTSTQYGLNIGVHATEQSPEVGSFVDLLKQEEFNVVSYEGDVQECVNEIKTGIVHACVSVPSSFSVQENVAKEVTFYVDPSKINLVWMIQESVGEKFDLRSQQIAQELTSNVLSRLASTNDGIGNVKGDVEGIKEKTGSASSATMSAKEELSSLDLRAPGSPESIVELKTSVTQSREKIDAALDAVESANITSSTKSTLRKAIKDAKLALGTGNGTEGSFGLAAQVSLLESDLFEARSKLFAASQKIESTTSALDNSASAISETNSALDAVSGVLTSLQEAIASEKVTEAGVIAAPLQTKIVRISEEGTYLNYLFPALLILVVMFSSLALGTTLVMIEKHSPAFFRNFFLPVKKVTFIASIYCTNLVVILVQIAVILGIAAFFLQESINAFPAVALILFVTASVFTFLGMIVGYLFTSEETATLASISLGSLSLFISGLLLPLEGMAPIFREIIQLNPFVIAEGLIREVFLFQASLGDVWIKLLILAGYAAGLFIVIWIMESILHKHLVHKFMRKHHKKHTEKVK
ncbi:hypothetical protein CL620_01380 [archaeon]|nr:hypothetical protein [archaeon]